MNWQQMMDLHSIFKFKEICWINNLSAKEPMSEGLYCERN